jgi:glucose-1-phosphate thymidylyltransferase
VSGVSEASDHFVRLQLKALILAAGYATRLRPLTDTWAKELLPVGGRPILDSIVDRIDAVGEIDEVHIVTNTSKAPAIRAWAEGRAVVVHDDRTTSNDDRLGAIGDMRFVLQEAEIDDDLLVIAGDNLFEFSLVDLVVFWRARLPGSVLAVRDVGSIHLARRYGIVSLDADDRIVEFVEKPDDPPSTLAATATYLYAREHVQLVETYLDEGNEPDQPGRFVAWLHRREPVYGWRFDGDWFDIGDHAQLLEADNQMRTVLGLPVRAVYSPE